MQDLQEHERPLAESMSDKEKTCESCGRKFTRKPRSANARWEASRFCSIKCNNLKGSRASHYKHGYTKTSEYYTFQSAIDRCANPRNKSYCDYGGRGITFHQEWIDSPKLFFEHIGPKPSKGHQLDRIDSNGNYEPGNVRWVTAREQQRNRRNVRLIAYNSGYVSAREYCELTNFSYVTFQKRLKRGLSIEEALSLDGTRRCR